MKKYFKARGLKENYDPQNKHKDIFYFAEDTGQLLLDGVSYSEATDLTPYAKAINLPDSVISNADISSDANSVTLKYTKDNLIDGGNGEVNLQIPAATHTNAGVMTVADKRKLNSLVNYKAGNGIDITGDTISCTLDTSLYSIVTELPETGLTNKIYLLPSTETEEGNIYTEYGYVDNKWEELGKYKADIDLSPYAKAMNLPKYIVGQDVDGGDIMSSHYYPDKVKVKFVRVNLIDNSNLNDWFDINSVTTAYAGVMSCIDKRKLDGIEKGAQVNKIESVSVNGTPLEITNKGVNIPNATTEKDGMMSKADKAKLDSLENYTLPAATTTTLGGVKVGYLSGHVPSLLHINNGNLTAKVTLNYIKDSKTLKLIDGVDYSEISAIDCTDFIKDGMLESATVEVNPEGYDAGTYIKLVFNTDAGKDPVYINVSDLIHEYTAGDGIKLENSKFSLDTLEHTERSYTTELIGPKFEPALNIPIVDESGKLNKNILIPNVADLSNRTPTEWTGEIDDLGCIRYEDYKNISDYYYNFTKNIFFCPIQDNQLLMYNIGKGIDDDKLNDFLKNPDNYDNWNIPVAIYLSDGLLASGGLYGEVPVHDPNDYSKIYYPGGVFGFKVNIDKSENNLLTFTEGEDYTDGFSPAIVNTKKLIVPKQSVIDTIVNSNEFKAKQDVLVSGDGINISDGVISTTPISIKTEEFSFVNSGSHQPTYNYSGVTIYDDRYISGTKYGIAFDEADIKPRTTITSPDGVRTVCFALDQSVRRKIENAITSIKVNNVEQVNANGAVDLTIPNASITENGLMSKEDKAKLDSQPTIKANNATGVTDDDYVVIKKSEYQSILDRLSALEGS